MDILGDLGVTMFIVDDDDEEALEQLQKVVARIMEAALHLNLKKCQLGWYRMNYLGFQVSRDLGVSDGYCEKLE